MIGQFCELSIVLRNCRLSFKWHNVLNVDMNFVVQFHINTFSNYFMFFILISFHSFILTSERYEYVPSSKM